MQQHWDIHHVRDVIRKCFDKKSTNLVSRIIDSYIRRLNKAVKSKNLLWLLFDVEIPCEL